MVIKQYSTDFPAAVLSALPFPYTTFQLSDSMSSVGDEANVMPHVFESDDRRNEVSDYKVILFNVAYATYAHFLQLYVSYFTTNTYFN